MSRIPCSSRVALLLILIRFSRYACGQAAPQEPAYTLHATTRVVLTDVIVQDRVGNPVTGLKASSFHILDENKAQAIVAFEEHRLAAGGPVSQPVAAPRGVYSNAFLNDPATALNILLVDLTTIGFADQSQLREQLLHFADRLAPHQYVALYAKNGERTVPILGFTDDGARLKQTIAALLPRLPTLGVDHTAADWVATLDQIAGFLTNVPGRKNIFWFAGNSDSFETPDDPGPSVGDLQPLFDELEANRIAIFPVDARGLTVFPSAGETLQHLTMAQIAQTTGGRAYYNGNGLGDFTVQASQSNASFYTLTYTPHDVRFDNRWHHVKILVEGDDGQRYQLQYRRGYFDDGGVAGHADPTPTIASGVGPAATPQARIRLLEDGSTRRLNGSRKVPIVFTATVLPASDPGLDPSFKSVAPVPPPASAKPPRNLTALAVQYEIPVNALVIQPDTAGDADRDRTDVAVSLIAYNDRGRVVGRYLRHVTLTFKPDYLIDHPNEPFRIREQIGLPRGQTSIVLAVEDMTSERTGTLQLSLGIPAEKHASQ